MKMNNKNYVVVARFDNKINEKLNILRSHLYEDGYIKANSEWPPHLMFLKGYLPDGFAEKVYHIHVVNPSDHDELRFRDYLIEHPEAATAYAVLKQRLFQDYEHDRDGYTEAKTAFISSIVDKAKKEGGI
jgi:GrpB-like predicted nucleotidyltransferase (UPF0157 family)